MKPQHRIKVAMVADYPFDEEDLLKGGVKQANYRLVKALVDFDEVDLTVVTQSPRVTMLQKRLEGNASIIFFPPKNLGYDVLLLYSGQRRALADLFDEVKPDMIHAQGIPSYIFATLRARYPSIITIHGVYRNELRVLRSRTSLKDRLTLSMIKNIESYNFSRIRNLIAITSEIEAMVRARSPHVRVFRIDNPIDEGFFALEDHSSKPIILFVGWVTYRKGVHLLLEALSDVLPLVPEIEIRIIGLEDMDPEYGPSLRASHADMIKSGHISFLGGVEQTRLYEELSQCSLLCLPSLADSAPMVIAEAMAAGKPVVATRVGGIPQMVEDGTTGRLCAPDDSKQLAGCLAELLQDDSTRREMGRRARRFADKRYRASSVARATLDAYQEVLDAPYHH